MGHREGGTRVFSKVNSKRTRDKDKVLSCDAGNSDQGEEKNNKSESDSALKMCPERL